MKRFAQLVIEKRLIFLIGIIVLTLFFLYLAITRLPV